MKTETSDVVPDVTLADFDTPAFRQQRVIALRRELDGAMDMLTEIATVLTNAGVPGAVDGVDLHLADRVRWLTAHGLRKESVVS